MNEQYRQRIKAIHQRLGIAEDYGDSYGLSMQPEADELAGIGEDIYGREQFLSPDAARLWFAMQAAARADGIMLYPVSAFRSVERQTEIVEAKLNKGLVLEEILAVSAAPGYSEHHNGCALDVTTDDCEALEECFDQTSAFEWLTANAARFHFHLSYPKSGRSKICYEPWHWAYVGDAGK